jgi:hypothetical protein
MLRLTAPRLPLALPSVATPSQPVGQTVSHSAFLRKIRGRGMAVVYEAEDVKLWNLIEGGDPDF